MREVVRSPRSGPVALSELRGTLRAKSLIKALYGPLLEAVAVLKGDSLSSGRLECPSLTWQFLSYLHAFAEKNRSWQQ